MIAIRTSTGADLAAVDALLARSYPKLLKADYPASVLATALPLISRAQPDLLTCGTYYLAEEAGELRAAGGWTRDRKASERGHIRHVVCDDRHLRRGIARAVLERCFMTARAAGVVEMECWSTLTGGAFYRALGFEVLGPKDVALAGGVRFASLRMMRRL